MSEPYDVSTQFDRQAGLRRFCDRHGNEWTEPDPGSPMRRLAELEAACGRFADFLAWIEALVANGDIEPVTDHTALCQLSGGGGSQALTVGDLRLAREAIQPSSTAPRASQASRQSP